MRLEAGNRNCCAALLDANIVVSTLKVLHHDSVDAVANCRRGYCGLFWCPARDTHQIVSPVGSAHAQQADAECQVWTLWILDKGLKLPHLKSLMLRHFGLTRTFFMAGLQGLIRHSQ